VPIGAGVAVACPRRNGLARSGEDVRARLALQRAGVVETLRALADDLTALPDDRLGLVLPRLQRLVDALRVALDGAPPRRARRRPAGRRRR